MEHGTHSHGGGSYNAPFAIGITLNIAFIAAEISYGFSSNSLALIADATHNVSDVVGLALAWGAAWLIKRAPTARRTYGYRKSSILAAIANATLLLLAVGGILFESIQRVFHPEPIAATAVIFVAGFGVIINGASALLFLRGRRGDLNIRGAFVHLASDAGVSFGVIVAAIVGHVTGFLWVDPVTGILISILVLFSTWKLSRDAFNLAFDAIPSQIDPSKVRAYLASLPNVIDVHDMHIWPLSTTETALTAHLVRPQTIADDALLSRAARSLELEFSIQHTALQIEAGDPMYPCHLAPAEHV